MTQREYTRIGQQILAKRSDIDAVILHDGDYFVAIARTTTHARDPIELHISIADAHKLLAS